MADRKRKYPGPKPQLVLGEDLREWLDEMDDILGERPHGLRLVIDRRGIDDVPKDAYGVWMTESKRLRVSVWSCSHGPTEVVPVLPGRPDPRKRASVAMVLATLAHERVHASGFLDHDNVFFVGHAKHDTIDGRGRITLWSLVLQLWWPEEGVSFERILKALAANGGNHDDAIVDLLWEDFPWYRRYYWASPDGIVEVDDEDGVGKS